jgi:competence protein ComEC
LGIFSLGALWLCIWQSRWRLWGLLPMAAGLATMLLYVPPDVLVAADGKHIAVRLNTGEMVMVKGKGESFAAKQWAHEVQQAELETLYKKDRMAMPASSFVQCDENGCIYKKSGHVVAFADEREALAEDCRSADVVVVSFYLSPRECAPAKIIDRRELETYGTHALWLNAKEIKIKDVVEMQGNRVWRTPLP